jgi:SAM-dependent methyltransferase
VTEDDYSAAYWDGRYRSGESTSPPTVSPSFVTEAGPLPPGRALDAGCGRGAAAMWLAARGWAVTAVDISATALLGARRAAQEAGLDVEWVEADMSTWEPGERRFDLVASQYVHVPGPMEDLFRRLASWVAPGGTLIVVGHDDHGHGPGAQITVDQVTSSLSGDWEVVVAESRTSDVRPREGSAVVTLHDVVVRARRP